MVTSFSWPRRSAARAADSRRHPRCQRRQVVVLRGLGGACDLGEPLQARDVGLVLLAPALVASPGLGADQGLRRSPTFRDVRHVEVLGLEHDFQVFASVLAHTEAVILARRIAGESRKLLTVLALAAQLGLLPPIPGRLRRHLAALKQKLDRVLPEAGAPGGRVSRGETMNLGTSPVLD